MPAKSFSRLREEQLARKFISDELRNRPIGTGLFECMLYAECLEKYAVPKSLIMEHLYLYSSTGFIEIKDGTIKRLK